MNYKRKNQTQKDVIHPQVMEIIGAEECTTQEQHMGKKRTSIHQKVNTVVTRNQSCNAQSSNFSFGIQENSTKHTRANFHRDGQVESEKN